ncbi:hypothetical protein DSLPV1_134 [Dishui lake phycodnavirus 1]|uniref:hypothetical protein n=1 Tax=Dishui lake phycodnavirus 1 TaxID=2079134 RepID=UPI000CD685BC|nr:hypothetical protein C5Y57_gp134 [Dishui lake phycodnavirus 1]AUT19105.1 hypothetical protein DSLPV1_134 [Dishui lake phycodnavirus 1]
MREPRPEEYDHYPERELEEKSDERRAYENAMRRYWRWKASLKNADTPRSTLAEIFDQSLGDDNSMVVQTMTRNHVVFHNTVLKIKMKALEFGGPSGFQTIPLRSENASKCKAVIFDDAIHPKVVQECLRALCPDLVIDVDSDIQSEISDTWLLVL